MDEETAASHPEDGGAQTEERVPAAADGADAQASAEGPGQVVSETGEGSAAPDAAEPQEAERQPELSPEERKLAENNALARLFDKVRENSRDGKLTVPDTWAADGLVPAHMAPEEFEMFVFDYLEDYRKEHPQEVAYRKERSSSKRHVRSAYRTATHAVGVPHWFDKKESEPAEGGSQEGDAGDLKGNAAVDALEIQGPFKTTAIDEAPKPVHEQSESDGASRDEVYGKLDIPEGYRLVDKDGTPTLVEDPTAKDDAPKKLDADCSHIVALEGQYSYYLYDDRRMTDAYAHWAYLAAEDNPLVTFADCVREESRTYPRPMAESSFGNDPLRMTAQEVRDTWQKIQESGNYPDLARTTASNGDVYYFSTKYLEPDYANSLAEWESVGRYMNV